MPELASENAELATEAGLAQPTPEFPPAIEPHGSPLLPQHVVDLFLRPTRFFRGQLALGKTPYVLFTTWVLGMSGAIDRVDTQLMKAELGSSTTSQLWVSALGTWPDFWVFVAMAGALSGLLHWYVGGWWCRVRLQWAGAPDPDPKLARLLLIYSSFVFAGPAVLSAGIQTALYPSYAVAYEQEIWLTLGVMCFIFWSIVTTYRGARALFPVNRGRALLWFGVLPAIFYFAVAGGAAVLFAFAGTA